MLAHIGHKPVACAIESFKALNIASHTKPEVSRRRVDFRLLAAECDKQPLIRHPLYAPGGNVAGWRGSGRSHTSTSEVNSNAPIDAAFVSAVNTTFAGSTIPCSSRLHSRPW